MTGVVLFFAPSDTQRSVSEGYDLTTEGITGRLVGEPAPGRAVGSPDVPRALAFATADVSELTESIARSTAFDDAQLVTIASLRQAVETSREVCAGVPRPTTAEDILDTRAFRITQDGAVADVRLTEFDDGEVVDRVLQASRSAWESCDGMTDQFGSTVKRSVLSFSSISGTPGVNLRSDLVDDSCAVVSSSQTLAVPAGEVLIEIRLIVDGTLRGQIDPVALLAEVEALV